MKYFKRNRSENLHENIKLNVSEPGLTYMFYTVHENLKDEDNEIEEEEINAALNLRIFDPS